MNNRRTRPFHVLPVFVLLTNHYYLESMPFCLLQLHRAQSMETVHRGPKLLGGFGAVRRDFSDLACKHKNLLAMGG